MVNVARGSMGGDGDYGRQYSISITYKSNNYVTSNMREGDVAGCIGGNGVQGIGLCFRFTVY